MAEKSQSMTGTRFSLHSTVFSVGSLHKHSHHGFTRQRIDAMRENFMNKGRSVGCITHVHVWAY